LEPGEHDGKGYSVMRALCAANKAVVAALVCYRTPAWLKNTCAVVCARLICKNA
jgi:hypothetical protein